VPEGWSAFSNLVLQMQDADATSNMHVLLRYVVQSFCHKSNAIAQAEAFDLQRIQHYQDNFVPSFEGHFKGLRDAIHKVRYHFSLGIPALTALTCR
jgi:hypothetical protein